MKKLKPEELLLTLTDREKDVLLLVCQHKNYQEIADAFFLTKGTIRTHMFNIYGKLELDHLDRDERVLKIHNTFCPLLQKQSDQQKTQPEIEMIEETPNPDSAFLDEEGFDEESPDPEPFSTEEEQVAEETPDPEPVSPDDVQVTEEPSDPESISPGENQVIEETLNKEPLSPDEEEVDAESTDPEPFSTEEEQVAEETPDPEPISPEDEKMIDEDEKVLVAYRPKPNTGGKKVMETKKKRGCTRFIITLLLGALIVIGAWYAWENYLKNAPIVQSIVPKSISYAGAYEVGEWAQQDDVWVRVSEYKVTTYWVSVYFEVWNKKGHEYFFAWGPRENFSMVDNQNNKYTATDTYERQVNLDIDERKKIWGVSSATVQFDNDPIYKPGVTDLYITMEYFATIENAVFHIDLTK